MNDIAYLLIRARADITLPLGLLLATLVTLHVLWHRRDVASAVGWIGFAWFAPVTGAIIYAVFGVNRVQRRARVLRPQDPKPQDHKDWPSPWDDDRLDALQRGIGRITGRPVVTGNRLYIYQNGDEAYPPMLDAIATAQFSVGLSSYIFRDDIWGTRFIKALAAAQQRGVAVRVLIDGIGGGWLLSRTYHRLRRAGVPAARFLHSPLPWRMPFLNLRSHRKILTVDGRIGFTGGMNIADENVMQTKPREPVQDTHFKVVGPVVCQLAEAFAQDWLFAANEELHGDGWFGTATEDGPATARVVDSGPDEDLEKVEFAVLQAVACARESITVMTPYFLPDTRLISALGLAAMRGVAVDIVIPEISNHRLVDWATRENVGPLLDEGVRMWLSPPPFRHSKVMVVDGVWCLVGSCNWDIRSFRLNFELCLEVYDRNLAAELSGLVQRNSVKALTQADLNRRSGAARLRDAALRLMSPYL